jgi:hypothetical protein
VFFDEWGEWHLELHEAAADAGLICTSPQKQTLISLSVAFCCASRCDNRTSTFCPAVPPGHIMQYDDKYGKYDDKYGYDKYGKVSILLCFACGGVGVIGWGVSWFRPVPGLTCTHHTLTPLFALFLPHVVR